MRLISGWMMLSVNFVTKRGERGADDHRDGQVDDVAAGEKLLEALQHACKSFLQSSCYLTYSIDVSRAEPASVRLPVLASPGHRVCRCERGRTSVTAVAVVGGGGLRYWHTALAGDPRQPPRPTGAAGTRAPRSIVRRTDRHGHGRHPEQRRQPRLRRRPVPAAAALSTSVEGERHGLHQRRARPRRWPSEPAAPPAPPGRRRCPLPSASSETRTTTASVATTAGCDVGIRRAGAAASTSTTSPGRTRSSSAVSASGSGTMRASGPAADSASRGPSSRTSVSTSPRRAGPASVAPTTASTSDCEPSGTVVAERFSIRTSAAVSSMPGARSRAATTIVGAVVVRIGAKRRDRGQEDKRACQRRGGRRRCATNRAAARRAADSAPTDSASLPCRHARQRWTAVGAGARGACG